MTVDQARQRDLAAAVDDPIGRPRGFDVGGLADGGELAAADRQARVADDAALGVDRDEPVEPEDQQVGRVAGAHLAAPASPLCGLRIQIAGCVSP